MGNLFDLIASIGTPPASAPASTPRRVELLVPAAANDPQPPAEAPPAPAAPAPLPTPAPAAERPPAAPGEPQRFARSAATASPAWRVARDQYLNHAMTCRACHPPTGRYCPAGAELRAVYNDTPMEPTP